MWVVYVVEVVCLAWLEEPRLVRGRGILVFSEPLTPLGEMSALFKCLRELLSHKTLLMDE